MNEDREWLKTSGDSDCELCAGNKQGRIDRYLQRGKRKVCDCGQKIDGWSFLQLKD